MLSRSQLVLAFVRHSAQNSDTAIPRAVLDNTVYRSPKFSDVGSSPKTWLSGFTGDPDKAFRHMQQSRIASGLFSDPAIRLSLPKATTAGLLRSQATYRSRYLEEVPWFQRVVARLRGWPAPPSPYFRRPENNGLAAQDPQWKSAISAMKEQLPGMELQFRDAPHGSAYSSDFREAPAGAMRIAPGDGLTALYHEGTHAMQDRFLGGLPSMYGITEDRASLRDALSVPEGLASLVQAVGAAGLDKPTSGPLVEMAYRSGLTPQKTPEAFISLMRQWLGAIASGETLPGAEISPRAVYETLARNKPIKRILPNE